jgi:hypothetical protein
MYREVMDASGLNFRGNNDNTAQSQEITLYHALQYCGPDLHTLLHPFTPVRLGSIDAHKINPRTIRQVLAVILQQLAVRCASAHHPFAPFGPTEAQEIMNILSPPAAAAAAGAGAGP